MNQSFLVSQCYGSDTCVNQSIFVLSTLYGFNGTSTTEQGDIKQKKSILIQSISSTH